MIIEQILWRTYIFYLSTLYLIDRRKKAKAQVTRKRQICLGFFFLSSERQQKQTILFFLLCLPFPLPHRVLALELSSCYPSIYLTACRSVGKRIERERANEENILFLFLLLLLLSLLMLMFLVPNHRAVINY